MNIGRWEKIIFNSESYSKLAFLGKAGRFFIKKVQKLFAVVLQTSRIYQGLSNIGNRFVGFRRQQSGFWEALDRRWGKIVEAGIILTIALMPVLNSWGMLFFLVLILNIIRFPERKLPDTGLFLFWLALMISSVMSLGIKGPGRLVTVTVWLLTAYLAGHTFTVNFSRKIIRLMLVAGVIWILIGLRQQGAGVSTPSGWLEQGQNLLISVRSFSVFGNPNVYGQYLISIIILALSELTGRKLEDCFFPGLILILGVISLYYTYSRTAWVLGVAGVSFWFGKRTFSRKFLYIGILGLGLFCLPGFKTRFFNPVGFFGGTLWLRVRIWRNMLKILADFWLWGSGPGSFNEVYQSYLSTNGLIGHGHQLYLQLWLENGIFSLLAFIRVLFKNLTGFISSLSTAGAVALVIFTTLMFGFLETWWVHQFSGGYFWLFIGLLQSLRTGLTDS
jgi:O-antigen ligase